MCILHFKAAVRLSLGIALRGGGASCGSDYAAFIQHVLEKLFHQQAANVSLAVTTIIAPTSDLPWHFSTSGRSAHAADGEQRREAHLSRRQICRLGARRGD